MAFRRKGFERCHLEKNRHTKLPLVDDPAVREVFASELVNVTAAADTVTITLCTSRTIMDGPELRIQRVVSARLVVPADTALNISNRIQQLLRQKQLLEAAKSSKPM